MNIDQRMEGNNISLRYEVEIVDEHKTLFDAVNFVDLVDKIWINVYFPAHRYTLTYRMKYVKEYSPRLFIPRLVVLHLDRKSSDDYTMTQLCRKVSDPSLHRYLDAYAKLLKEKYDITVNMEVELDGVES